MNAILRPLTALLVAALVTAAGASGRADDGRAALDAALAKNQPQQLHDFLDFIALPDDAIVPADVAKNAEWLRAAFVRAGMQSQLLANDGKPMVFAASSPVRPAAKTVLFYMHLDGQPVVPSAWHQASPWIPILKARATDGTYAPIPTDRLFAGPIDPEWRLFARAAADDKAPIVELLAVMTALRDARLAPSVNVKVIVDSEEEKGSPSIARVLAANAALLRADALVICDMPMHASNRPTIVYGNRGVIALALTVYGPKHAAHSGHYGNIVPNPAFALARLLAGMKNDDGRVLIPGWYDGVTIDERAKAILAAVPDATAETKASFVLPALERGVAASPQEALQYPSLNIEGLQSAQVGDKAAAIIPDKAVAAMDIRTVPEIPGEQLVAALRRYIEAQGYTLLDREPTDADRLAHAKLASIATNASAAVAVRAGPDTAVGRWTRGALERAFGGAPVEIRMSGATVPTADMVGELKIPFVILPLVNADDNQHTSDENLRMGNYRSGIASFEALLTLPYPT
jgi:acetylornithine deacetylase/succinyl-diaminopimelate desuccinylase-like protein